MYLLICEDGDMMQAEAPTAADMEEAELGVLEIVDVEKMERYGHSGVWEKIVAA